MASVDDRVVNMEFNNDLFSRKISDSINDLNKLGQSLDMAGAKKGLQDVSDQASRFNLGNMAAAVEGVSGKFLALSTVAITALANITTKAVDAAGRMLKAFTFDPIQQGFQEFELNMGSIQTILSNTASKGSTLADVNKSLDQLNEYSDKTIYNFGEMAKNIGTFTAAGVGLDTSVSAIKGIANLAAISGSNSQQASTAMYQLSQALAAGRVSLMDWNSVVNAGMGGEVFQKALFETAKSLKTIKDVPMSMTFDEWKKAGNSFRDSLQDQWITTDVLTNTLSAFTGDLDEAQLKALGYTDAQAKEFAKLGKMGSSAAQDVKTLSQLVSTVKESVGSGWSQTFRLVIGDFEESKSLFTSINNTIGGFVSKSADARNALLQQWKDLGGRTTLIEGFKDAFWSLGKILSAVKEGFTDVFPPMTAERLVNITKAFADFTNNIRELTTKHLSQFKLIFTAVFAGLQIGWTVIKETAKLFSDLIKSLIPDSSGSKILDFFTNISDSLVKLNYRLVEAGGIHKFFENLETAIQSPIDAINKLEVKIGEFFSAFGDDTKTNAVEESTGRISSRFDHLKGVLDALSDAWERVSKRMEGVRKVLGDIGGYVSTWFGELKDKLVNVLKPGDFDAAVDAVNVGLLGGIALLIRKFVNQGLKVDFSGVIEKVTGVLDTLQSKLKLMQTSIKADILLKIAGAVGILSASVLVLSLIDSAALTKSLTAVAVGFGQLVGTLALLQKTSGGGAKAGASIALLGAAMIEVSTAILILAGAVKVISSLSVEEVAKGVAGITFMLASLTGAIKIISGDISGVISASIAMTAMATAIDILSAAVVIFGNMSFGEMAKGLTGVAVSLGIIATVMKIMPVASTLAAGIAMIPLATGITILAGAVALFGAMSLETIGKGLLGIAGGLGVIGLTMNLFPVTTPIIAAGLVLVGIALTSIAGAVALMGNIPLGETAKGIGAIAVTLGILAVSLAAMSGTAAGAASLVITAVALGVLAEVIKTLGEMDVKTIAIGLGAIAAAMAILGVGSLLLTPAIPAMEAFGSALLGLGASFALFGVGAFLVAKAFETLAESGKAGVSAFIDILKSLVKAVPELVAQLITSVGESLSEIGQSADLLVRVIGTLLGHILDTIIEMAPKIGEALVALVITGLSVMRQTFPQIVSTGIDMIMTLLSGIRDHIGEITNTAIDIIINFAKAISDRASDLTNSAADVIIAFLNGISDRTTDIVNAGFNILTNLLLGIGNNLVAVANMVGWVIASFINAVSNNLQMIIDSGADLIIKFIKGIGDKATDIVNAGGDTIISFIKGLGSKAVEIANAAGDAIVDFLNGMTAAIDSHAKEIRDAGWKLAGAIINGVTGGLAEKAKDVTGSVVGIFKDAVGGALSFLKIKSPSRVFMEIGEQMAAGVVVALNRDTSAENSVVDMAERVVQAFADTLGKAPEAALGIENINPVITPILDLSKIQDKASTIGSLLSVASISPDMSIRQANLISTTTDIAGEEPKAPEEPREITFVQNNYSPSALSTNDIYRNTKSQIAIAKEELKI